MRSIIALIAFPLMAALAGCSGHPWQPSPAAKSCQHAPAAIQEYFARRVGLRIAYVEAACSLGWSFKQVRLRASSRDYTLCAPCDDHHPGLARPH